MSEMRVVTMGADNTNYGGPEVLVSGARPTPTPERDEVLIAITACGVNGPDLVQRRGHYPPPKGASDLLGLEVSGEVVAIGDDVSRWTVGDRVCALTNGGGYAEQVAVCADHCLPIPEGVDEQDAAGLCETFFTVFSNVFFGHQVPEGARLLVHGGAGGIGSTAIQLGKARGLEVYCTAAEAQRDFCAGLGADRVIDYQQEDFVSVLREVGGADIIVDIIGGDTIARNIKAARHDARLIQLAFNAGSKVELNLMPVMLKRLIYTGSTLRSRPEAFKSAVARSLEAEVWPLFAERKLRAVTHTVLPLEQATEAHAMMEAARHQGKILLSPSA